MLVIMDECSRFPVVGVVRSTSAEAVITVVDNVLCLLGYSEIGNPTTVHRSIGTCGKHACNRMASVILASRKCASRGIQHTAHESHQNCRKRAIHYNGNDYILWCRLADKPNCLVLLVLPLSL